MTAFSVKHTTFKPQVGSQKKDKLRRQQNLGILSQKSHTVSVEKIEPIPQKNPGIAKGQVTNLGQVQGGTTPVLPNSAKLTQS